MNYLQFAYRNILRHRRRSIVTIMTVCLGFVALGVLGGFLNNIFSRLKGQAIVAERFGHLTFAKKGFHENGKLEPEKYLWNAQELAKILSVTRQNVDVELATPRLRMFGVTSNGKASTIFVTEAIVPEDDQKLIKTNVDGRTEIAGMVTFGAKKQDNSTVIVGSELATMMKIKNGQNLTLLTSTKDGVANAVDVKISGNYNTGNPATNDKFILSDFSLAQNLYDTDGAERVIVTLKNPENIDVVKTQLLEQLSSAGLQVEAKTWEELSPSYKKVTTLFGIIFRVLTIIISVIVLLTVLNTMQMVVSERTKEIGTMRAIGMLRSQVVKLFCVEGLIMGIMGCVLAIPILLAIAGILQVIGISFVPPVASVAVPLVLMLKVPKLIFVFALFSIVAIVSSFLVSRKIANQQIVDSLIQSN
ncbi:FtsX-like permease family protein [Arcicella sp. LKC2W]|uniref:ABC transporter permease n=1 Tax=Arcicella sp. LKC2W TaxID=2984198 RepID=UPI002B213FC8|nr:FtsX-like permease family protein [Arcicella sp. LKC2W]MEA5460875.1 FtsX-like permease family protein [Arcicella sp. LKC2W]